MGKETDIWDDSSLLKAFDNAITKYQKMHDKTRKEQEAFTDNACENDSGFTKSVNEACTSSCNAGVSNGLPPVQNDQLGADFSTSESYKHPSSVPPAQEILESNTELQGAEYSQLLSRYYELELQRQNVLQQLHQVSYWGYQISSEGSGSCLPGNVSCDPSEAQVHTHHASSPGHFSCCFTCCCHCSIAPCPSVPTCAIGGQYFGESGTHAVSTANKIDPMRPPPYADSSTVKAAKEAAERAISSIKLTHSLTSNSPEEKAVAKKESSGASAGGVSQSVGLETDLSVVLSGWYSAGFYTGKYLLEQSHAKSRQ